VPEKVSVGATGPVFGRLIAMNPGG